MMPYDRTEHEVRVTAANADAAMAATSRDNNLGHIPAK
jgi:hypothetical protein